MPCPDEKIWIVVPAYNEGSRIACTLASLRDYRGRVVVVDDGSRDDTAEAAARCDVWVLRHPINCGQGAALQTGLRFALAQGAQVLVTFDADGQHTAADIARLTDPIVRGECETTLGSRFLGSAHGMPLRRRLLLKAAVQFTRCVSRIDVTDTHNGLRAFSRRAATMLEIREDRMAHASEILHQIQTLKIPFREVPVRLTYSRQTLDKGQSGWNAVAIAGRLLLGRLLG